MTLIWRIFSYPYRNLYLLLLVPFFTSITSSGTPAQEYSRKVDSPYVPLEIKVIGDRDTIACPIQIIDSEWPRAMKAHENRLYSIVNGTLYIYKANGRIVKEIDIAAFCDKFGLVDGSIFDIFIDSNNNFWLGTAKGLLFLDKDAKKPTIINDLPTDQRVYVTAQDKTGALIASATYHSYISLDFGKSWSTISSRIAELDIPRLYDPLYFEGQRNQRRLEKHLCR